MSEVTKIYWEGLLYLNCVMNLPYAQGHFKVLMSKDWGGGAQLAKTFGLLWFNTMMMDHNIKTTCQILLLTLKQLRVGDLHLTPGPCVPSRLQGLRVHLRARSAVNLGPIWYQRNNFYNRHQTGSIKKTQQEMNGVAAKPKKVGSNIWDNITEKKEF